MDNSTEANSMDIPCCYLCKSQIVTIDFCCGHKICSDCLVANYLQVLKNFKALLSRNPLVLDGKSSCLGCPLHCPESDMSMSLRYINQFAQLSALLSPEEKQFFSEITELSVSFFSGIRCYFFECIRCDRMRSDIEPGSFICRSCIEGLLESKFGRLYQYSIDWKNTNEKVKLFRGTYGKCDLFVVKFDPEASSYDFQSVNDNIRIYKLKEIGEHAKALIIQAISFDGLEDEEYFTVDGHDMASLVYSIIINK